MTVLMTKTFGRFARKAGLSNGSLVKAAAEVAAGDFDAHLGGGVYKQRVARTGKGKSGGFRTIILFREGGHSIFVHGFAKSAKANVTAKELKALRQLARLYLAYSGEEIAAAVAGGTLIEVMENEQED